MSNTDKPIIQLVVGVHRSGTSVSTQVLSVLGLDLGRTLMLPAFDNPRGFWENSKIVAAHDRLLNVLGVDWTTAAALPETWEDSETADAAVEELVDILATDFDTGTNKLIKDPRLTVLLPLWSRVAEKSGHDLHVLGALRHPSQVKASISKRNGFNDDVSDIIVSSQLAAMTEMLAPYAPPVILFERLTASSASEIVSAMSTALPHLKIHATKGMESLVGRIVGERSSRPEEGDDAYDAFQMKNETGLFVDWEDALPYLQSIKFERKRLKGKNSFLTKDAKMLSVPYHRFESLKQAEEQNVQLMSDYKRLEREFDDKAETLKSYVEKVNAISGSFAEERLRATELDKSIQLRDAKIRELNAETISLKSLRESLTRYEAEITSLRQRVAEDETKQEEIQNRVLQLQADIQSKTKESENAKEQRDGLNLEIRGLREQESRLIIREKELLNNIDVVKVKLEESAARQIALEADLKRLSRNVKAAKTRHQKKLKNKDYELSFLRGSIADLKENLVETRQRESAFEADAKEKTLALEDTTNTLNRIGGELYETKQSLELTEKNLAETTRIKEMQDTTIEMEALRSKMVEDEFASKVSVLENRLSYFEAAPFRVGLKSFLFSTLRLIRRGLPLPELMKLRMSRKMTGLALRLQPPAMNLNPEGVSLKADDTIDFAFPVVDNPVISIIVHVYNEISQTIACLKSI